MEELLPHKRCHKNNFDCIGASEKTYSIGTTKKKLVEEMNTGISSKYVISVAEW